MGGAGVLSSKPFGRGAAVIDVGDTALVGMRKKLVELTKKRDRLNERIEWLEQRIGSHPQRVREELARYDARQNDPDADSSFLRKFACDPRNIYGLGRQPKVAKD